MKKAVSKKQPEREEGRHTKEIKRYIGVISENFQHKMDIVVENFSTLNNKLDSHTEMIERIMLDVQEMKTNLSRNASIVSRNASSCSKQ
jgi:hypothetical protein